MRIIIIDTRIIETTIMGMSLIEVIIIEMSMAGRRTTDAGINETIWRN